MEQCNAMEHKDRVQNVLLSGVINDSWFIIPEKYF